jgi:ankyrin repeat protein
MTKFMASPLHEAAMGLIRISPGLISQCGVQGVDIPDAQLQTPLHVAADCDSVHVARMLLEAKANIHARDSNDCTPLHHAVFKGAVSTVKLLLDNGADVNARDCEGINVIRFNNSFAPLTVRMQLLECLVDAKADVNNADFNGYTPVHRAVFSKDADLIKYLVKHKADINAVSVEGTPLAVAAAYHQFSEYLLSSLISNGASLWDTGDPHFVKSLEHALLNVLQHLDRYNVDPLTNLFFWSLAESKSSPVDGFNILMYAAASSKQMVNQLFLENLLYASPHFVSTRDKYGTRAQHIWMQRTGARHHDLDIEPENERKTSSKKRKKKKTKKKKAKKTR